MVGAAVDLVHIMKAGQAVACKRGFIKEAVYIFWARGAVIRLVETVRTRVVALLARLVKRAVIVVVLHATTMEIS